MKTLKKYFFIILGCLSYAIAIALFLDPNSLAPGGVTGIAIIISHLTLLPTGILILMLNIPIMALGAWKLGFKFLFTTMFATFISSILITFFGRFQPITDDLLLAAISGGTLLAIGMGLIFRVGATTGGVDILVMILKLKYKHLKSSNLFLMMDACVIALSMLVFKNIDIGLYAIIAIVTFSKVFDMVLYGNDSARLVYIVSDHNSIICERIFKDMDIGFTYIHGEGPYTKNSQKIIMCALKKQSYPKLKEIVHELDPDAFVIVTWASDIYGEGFKDSGKQEF